MIDRPGERLRTPPGPVGNHFVFIELIAHSDLWRVGMPDHCKKLRHGCDMGQLSIGMNGGIRGLA